MANPSTPDPPYFTFVPYLPISSVRTIGEWRVGPIEAFNGTWREPRFEELAKTFMSAFTDRRGQPIDSPSAIWHEVRGIDGVLPSHVERLAIQTALDLGFLDTCPKEKVLGAMHSVWTSDNTELYVWPIDLVEGRIALRYGGVARTTDGGYTIGDDLRIQGPLELHIPLMATEADDRLLTATYKIAVTSDRAPRRGLARRIVTATSWLAKAWRNTPSITFPDRIVFLKTGFEALSDQSNVWPNALWLRHLYERVLGGQRPMLLDGLLWSPTEAERHVWPSDDGERHVTDLQYWFKAFGSARNDIIHKGGTDSLSFSESSAYDGPLFDIGERLLRESIRVAMSELGYSDMWRDPTSLARDALVQEISRIVGDPLPEA